LKNYKTPSALILSINTKTLELVEFENESLREALGGNKLLISLFKANVYFILNIN